MTVATLINKLNKIGAIKEENGNLILANIETGEVYAGNQPFTTTESISKFLKSHRFVKSELEEMVENW